MTRTIRTGSEYMKLHEDGAVSRPTTGLKPDAATWRITHAVEYNNLGGVVRRYALADILANPSAIPWQFKNGKQRTFLFDLDHGTVRQWCSPTHTVTP